MSLIRLLDEEHIEGLRGTIPPADRLHVATHPFWGAISYFDGPGGIDSLVDLSVESTIRLVDSFEDASRRSEGLPFLHRPDRTSSPETGTFTVSSTDRSSFYLGSIFRLSFLYDLLEQEQHVDGIAQRNEPCVLVLPPGWESSPQYSSLIKQKTGRGTFFFIESDHVATGYLHGPKAPAFIDVEKGGVMDTVTLLALCGTRDYVVYDANTGVTFKVHSTSTTTGDNVLNQRNARAFQQLYDVLGTTHIELFGCDIGACVGDTDRSLEAFSQGRNVYLFAPASTWIEDELFAIAEMNIPSHLHCAHLPNTRYAELVGHINKLIDLNADLSHTKQLKGMTRSEMYAFLGTCYSEVFKTMNEIKCIYASAHRNYIANV